MDQSLERIRLLIGEEGLEALAQATVMVVGIGGVGSFCAEALARCGVKNLILVDGDVVAESNLNRQIHAQYSTIGKAKVEVMEERIHTYQKDCKVIKKKIFYDASHNEELFSQPVDFVIDAIDTISSKADLIAFCKKHKIPFISSMGMANRWDPTKLECMDLMKTSYDPLAKVLRQIIRKRKIRGKIPVICSTEKPFVQHQIINEQGRTRKEKMPPASNPFVPSTAGLTCASIAVRTILKKAKK